MREMSVSEQRYKAALAVVADGRTITEVARDWGVSRQAMHDWLARYESDGLEDLGNTLATYHEDVPPWPRRLLRWD
jgi:transposase-like protein